MIGKRIKKQLITLLIIIVLILGISLAFQYIKWKQYEKEYNSTEWYEVQAEYSYSSKYTVRETVNDSVNDRSYYEDVDYYDWYYDYTAEDGSVHTYVDRRNSFETGGSSITILVDKYDPAHSLEIRTKENSSWAVKVAVILILISTIPLALLMILSSIFAGVISGKRRKV